MKVKLERIQFVWGRLVWGRAPSPVRVGTAALGFPAERSSAAVCGHSNSGFAMAKLKTMPGIDRPLLALALLAFLSAAPSRAFTYAQEPSAAPSSQSASAELTKEANQPAPEQKTISGDLAQKTRESTGEDQEENANLKHAAPVRWLARKTGLSVHQAHMVALSLNFATIVVIVFWAARKFLPGMLRNRNASIQHALEEARAASQDANRRLADIENRLRQLDVEIGRMQATAEKEAVAEEGRIQKAAEEDIRKVVLAAEQEITAAAKQARRELTTHTAGLAIALARQQINVDSNTDQVLVRTFASKLTSQPSSHDHDDDNGKDGR
ncbi:MAG: ATP synthase F0 subunit B [Terriglobales bacterium]|jgi:F-type H+-transporting ATPase subunit b